MANVQPQMAIFWPLGWGVDPSPYLHPRGLKMAEEWPFKKMAAENGQFKAKTAILWPKNGDFLPLGWRVNPHYPNQ